MARSAVVACARLERSDYTLFPPPSCHRAPSSGFPESLTIQPNCQQRSERASVLTACLRSRQTQRAADRVLSSAPSGDPSSLSCGGASEWGRPADSRPRAGGSSRSRRHLSTRWVFRAPHPTKPQVQTEGRKATRQDFAPSMQIACASGTWSGSDPHVPFPQNDRKLQWPGRSSDT